MGSQIAKCHAFSAQVVGFTEVSRATLDGITSVYGHQLAKHHPRIPGALSWGARK